MIVIFCFLWFVCVHCSQTLGLLLTEPYRIKKRIICSSHHAPSEVSTVSSTSCRGLWKLESNPLCGALYESGQLKCRGAQTLRTSPRPCAFSAFGFSSCDIPARERAPSERPVSSYQQDNSALRDLRKTRGPFWSCRWDRACRNVNTVACRKLFLAQD